MKRESSSRFRPERVSTVRIAKGTRAAHPHPRRTGKKASGTIMCIKYQSFFSTKIWLNVYKETSPDNRQRDGMSSRMMRAHAKNEPPRTKRLASGGRRGSWSMNHLPSSLSGPPSMLDGIRRRQANVPLAVGWLTLVPSCAQSRPVWTGGPPNREALRAEPRHAAADRQACRA